MSYSIREIGENIKKSAFYKGRLTYNEPMFNHTTMKVGGTAELFVEPSNIDSLVTVLKILHSKNVPYFVLGGGSNIIVSDEGISGVVISTVGLSEISFSIDNEYAYVTSGAGVKTNGLTEFCVRYGLCGMENFAGLPGSIGGAVFMNARCYEKNISDVLVSVKYIEPCANDYLIKKYEMNITDWDYKKSPFNNKSRIIVEVTFKLSLLDKNICFAQKQASLENQEIIRERNKYFIQERVNKGHFKAPSAGSVFLNDHTFGKPSGKIIDEVGLKGLTLGGAQVAPWHGNFIINNGSASANDIFQLVNKIQDIVYTKTGFKLIPEIIFCGKSFN